MRDIEGVTSRQRLHGHGLGDEAIDAMLARGDLRQVSRGVDLERGAPDDRRRRLIAALLAVGPPVAVTDLDALWVAGHRSEPQGPLQLLVPHPRHPTAPEDVKIRSTTRFVAAEVRRVGLVPVVCPSWAFTDAAKTRTRRQLAEAVTAGIRQRVLSVDDLDAVMAARGVFPANTKLRRLVDELRSDVSYSGAERKLAARCRRAGHVVRQNHPISDGTGAVVALADLCFPDQRLVVEVDGPSHWLPGAAARDRRRDRQLHDLGWRVLRFAVYEVDEDLDAVVAEVLRALASAAA